MNNKYLAIDIGGTKISINLFSLDGFISRIREKTEKNGSNTAIPNQIIRIAKQICNENNIELNDIKKVGVSSCGPFDKHDGFINLVGPNICGGLSKTNRKMNRWKSVPLERILKYYFTDVTIYNDCIAAAMAEKLFGHGKKENDFSYITWSTGIGAGSYVNGKLLLGKNFNAPHLGHITVEPHNGRECGCGGYGHLEGEVSGSSLEKQFGKPAYELFSEYRKGNEKAIDIVTNAVKKFAHGLASFNTILDNKLFIIGGSVFEKNKHILLPLIQEEFAKISYEPLSKNVEIKSSSLGNLVADFGAASLIMPKEYIVHWKKFLQP